MGQPPAEILDEAACGRFPETDGMKVTAPSGRDTGVHFLTAFLVRTGRAGEASAACG